MTVQEGGVKGSDVAGEGLGSTGREWASGAASEDGHLLSGSSVSAEWDAEEEEVEESSSASGVVGLNGEPLFLHSVHVSDPGQRRLRADRFLSDRMSNVSRSFLQRCFGQGYISCGGVRIRSSYVVKPGDRLEVYSVYPVEEFRVEPEALDLDVVYEDADLLVVNKPAGMVVHPGHGHSSGTLVNGLLYYLRDVEGFSSGEDYRPGLVHRLDRYTSGLLVVGKSPEMVSLLSGQFFDRRVLREYRAVVWGRLGAERGTVRTGLRRDPRDRQRMWVCELDEGKEAVTHWRVEEELCYLSIVRCRLETGRMHQIRVHMSSLRHPVFGDGRYGGREALYGSRSGGWAGFVHGALEVCPRQALHASRMGFHHPRSGEWLEFEVGWPADIALFLDYWRSGSVAFG